MCETMTPSHILVTNSFEGSLNKEVFLPHPFGVTKHGYPNVNSSTPLKFNMEPENGTLEKETPLEKETVAPWKRRPLLDPIIFRFYVKL